MNEPQWLTWSRQLQAISQTGLAFTRDPYDRERYEALIGLAATMLAAHTATRADEIADLFRRETGYATPKIDVRAAVFDDQRRILMVREAMDKDRWTLPGGWADVNITLTESAIKEVREESGYDARVIKLAAVWDRTTQGHPPSVFSCAKLFFLCELAGGEARTSLETTGVAWFGRDEVPTDLSLGRVLPRQIERMFAHAANRTLPTDFD
ncbi:MAG TPA: NUDIX hydrolase [Steroidobacteraceae bacterium]|jgi:ADP-ribose pyrophosphatase YjhB (NUDIX family)|nr:NUDIX hydrolase [Steroidobacteraceae bacterium]